MSAASRHAGGAVESISDTALWVAIHRARESERPDALFRDPLARRLAGERGERIAASLAGSDRSEWPWAMRTLLFDRIIAGQVANGADLRLAPVSADGAASP